MSVLGRLFIRHVPVLIAPEGLTGHETVRILMNKNATMTRGKYAAQAVHAALIAYGIPHGAVTVLGSNPTGLRELPYQIRDAGLTEVQPGTLTAACEIVP